MSTPDSEFMSAVMGLEAAYLRTDDPEGQSGFKGGRQRWIDERSPLVGGIHRDGDFLDVGCANGLLAADLVTWAAERGYRLEPHGVDLGETLIDLATHRHRDHTANFHMADAWTWQPGRQWTFVYSLLDLTPIELRGKWLSRLYGWVEPGGRLIVGSYGSRSRGRAPVLVAEVLREFEFVVEGSSGGGDEPITRFAWVTKRGFNH